MRKSRYSESQIVKILKEVEGGRLVKEVCREYGISDATYYNWKSKSDIDSIREIYTTSRNPGPGFLLVVVGTRPLREGLSVSWCNKRVVTLERLASP